MRVKSALRKIRSVKMLSIQISREAESDLEDISFYTHLEWGERQAEKYLNDLLSCLNLLAKNPLIGQDMSVIQNDLRMFPFKSHYLFFIPKKESILIVRILGQQMDFEAHL
ncbi:MAG: plasmid stabilization protein ParE [Leeuwenhoekiella sp.]|nr:MAG: plasmid stabilization protein ParE [Leeuwenhoekiella sp.]